MLARSPVAATLPVRDLTAAKLFYSRKLGLEPSAGSRDLAQVMKALRKKHVVFEDYDLPGVETVDGVAKMGDHTIA